MKHLRSDWDGIQDIHQGMYGVPSSSIEGDEPVFLLRAKDPAAALTVAAWAEFVELQGGDPELVQRVRLWADEMLAWRTEHYPTSTVADVPKGNLRTL